ncbi:sensor histidine kinase [Oryzomicrobium sp.]|uniref:sensor histidine kinase n=1 Tax=Oryzomicrobium sp. TaxID=1911578 RepID=UPI0025D356E4|nr:sensor histidine kinase [Oryzomicrobium sp.]MCE1243458.1 sensor histidine kinase [Oryzomicrobium sp.]
MRRLLAAIVLIVLIVMAGASQAAPLVLTADTRHASLEGRLEHFADAANALSFEAVRQQRFTLLPEFRSLGYDTAAHWFRFELSNQASAAPARWVLTIGIPELEEVDIWVEKPEGGFAQYALGYHRPYGDRPYQTRLFAVPVDASGHTDVYFRVRTHNAINVTAELWQPGVFVANETRSNFHGGLYFGILLIAVLLYSILGAWLRDVVMAAYAGYIASQVLFNLGVTGYLPVLFALDAPWLVDVFPRIGWLGGAIAIVLMWSRLLELKQAYPRIHRLYRFTIVLNLALLPFALMPFLVTSALLVVVKLANYLNSLNFLIGMALVLIAWWRTRRVELMVYFVAFIIPALGTGVNTAANLGMLPQNVVALYQMAPLVHVLVMSCGLALRLRQVPRDKAMAEQKATLATQRTEEQRRFVAMLSHEFRNPLAAIDRSAQMIGIKTPELAAGESRRLAQIRGNVATLSGLVDNFLLTEALDHGGLALSRTHCPIRPLLEEAVRMLGEDAGKRVVLTVEPSDAAFSLDPTLLGMAVGNLMDNALRYSPPDTAVEIAATVSAGELRIRIADRGPSLNDEDLAMLGTPYYRADSSLGKKGSGLGYYFARRIVEAHGGNLQASAGDGGGMVVEIGLRGTAKLHTATGPQERLCDVVH